MAVYRESSDELPVYISVHSKSEAPGLLAGVPLAAAYPPLEPTQQRRLAARRHKTTYCYDFPSVFQTALRDIWAARHIDGEPGSMPPGAPFDLMPTSTFSSICLVACMPNMRCT